jgi:hypothetical protein
MPLRGARACFASEVPEDAKWDEAVIENATGGQRARARDLYEKSVEFPITLVPFLDGNVKLELRSTGEAGRALHPRPRPAPRLNPHPLQNSSRPPDFAHYSAVQKIAGEQRDDRDEQRTSNHAASPTSTPSYP